MNARTHPGTGNERSIATLTIHHLANGIRGNHAIAAMREGRMKQKSAVGSTRKDSLAQRYGQIQIPAVAAAARYQGKDKKKEDPPGEARGGAQTDERSEKKKTENR